MSESESVYANLSDGELFELVVNLRQSRKAARDKFEAADQERRASLERSTACSREYYDAWSVLSKRFE